MIQSISSVCSEYFNRCICSLPHFHLNVYIVIRVKASIFFWYKSNSLTTICSNVILTNFILDSSTKFPKWNNEAKRRRRMNESNKTKKTTWVHRRKIDKRMKVFIWFDYLFAKNSAPIVPSMNWTGLNSHRLVCCCARNYVTLKWSTIEQEEDDEEGKEEFHFGLISIQYFVNFVS